jgi:hypothetical protein
VAFCSERNVQILLQLTAAYSDSADMPHAGYASDVATLKPSGLSPCDKLGRTPQHNIL